MSVDEVVRWIMHIALSLCLLVGCVCRLDALGPRSRLDYRIGYYLIAVSSLAMLLMRFYDPEPMRWPGIGLMAGMLILLLAGGPRWKHGPPQESWRR